MRLNRYLGIANMLWTKKKRMIKHEKSKIAMKEHESTSNLHILKRTPPHCHIHRSSLDLRQRHPTFLR